VEPQSLGSRYLLEEQIGKGGMGVVWRGRDRVSGTVYAIKVLLPEYAADPSAVARFVRERTALLALRHPNVVALYDMIVEGDRLALVMELVPGGDLSGLRLGMSGRLTQAEAVPLAAQIADALAYAHAAGIVHRDLKPANVLVRQVPDGSWRALLADFGIARLAGQPGDTTTGMVVGTISYMSPEMISGAEPGPAADVYSLGVTVYELVAGQVPFTGIPAAVLNAHLHTEPRRPEGIGDALWGLIARCLAKRPEYRPSAAEVAAVLRGPAFAQPPFAQSPFATPAFARPMSVGVGPTGSNEATQIKAGATPVRPWGPLEAGSITSQGGIGQPPGPDAQPPVLTGPPFAPYGEPFAPDGEPRPWVPPTGAFYQTPMRPLSDQADNGPTLVVKRRIRTVPAAIAAAAVAVAALIAVAVLANPFHSTQARQTSADALPDSAARSASATPSRQATRAAKKTRPAAGRHPGTSAAAPVATGAAAAPTTAAPAATAATAPASTQASASSSPSPTSDDTGWECSGETNSTSNTKTVMTCIRVQGRTVYVQGSAWPIPASDPDSEQVEVVLSTPSGDIGHYVSPACSAGTCEYTATLTEPPGSYHAQTDYLWESVNEFQGGFTPWVKVTG
jgi:serine/threonine protein kinase, bacterial